MSPRSGTYQYRNGFKKIQRLTSKISNNLIFLRRSIANTYRMAYIKIPLHEIKPSLNSSIDAKYIFFSIKNNIMKLNQKINKNDNEFYGTVKNDFSLSHRRTSVAKSNVFLQH